MKNDDNSVKQNLEKQNLSVPQGSYMEQTVKLPPKDFLAQEAWHGMTKPDEKKSLDKTVIMPPKDFQAEAGKKAGNLEQTIAISSSEFLAQAEANIGEANDQINVATPPKMAQEQTVTILAKDFLPPKIFEEQQTRETDEKDNTSDPMSATQRKINIDLKSGEDRFRATRKINKVFGDNLTATQNLEAQKTEPSEPNTSPFRTQRRNLDFRPNLTFSATTPAPGGAGDSQSKSALHETARKILGVQTNDLSKLQGKLESGSKKDSGFNVPGVTNVPGATNVPLNHDRFRDTTRKIIRLAAFGPGHGQINSTQPGTTDGKPGDVPKKNLR